LASVTKSQWKTVHQRQKHVLWGGERNQEKSVHLHWIYCKKPIENDSKVKTNNKSFNVLLVITFVPAEEDGPAASTACWPNPCLCISTCSSGA